MMGVDVVILFSGADGWAEGIKPLGLSTVGIELNADACATAHAAGHPVIRADVRTYRPHLPHVSGVIASPPCQDFSVAGKGAGRSGSRGELIDLVPEWVARLRPDWIACEQVPPCLPIWARARPPVPSVGLLGVVRGVERRELRCPADEAPCDSHGFAGRASGATVSDSCQDAWSVVV